MTLCAVSGGLTAQTQTGADIATGMDFDRFGGVVAVTRNGRRMAVAAPRGDRNGNSDAGAVRVYDLVNGAWQQVGGELRGTPGAWFGSAIAFSADGNTLAVGAPLQQFGTGRNGAVTVFDFVNGGFTSVGSLFGAGADDQFGYSVALSDDGRRLAVGAPQDDSPTGQQNAGSVTNYRLSGGVYQPVGAPVYGASSAEASGRAIALSGDGTRLAVGAPLYQIDNVGRARVYDLANGSWQQVGADLTATQANAQFGGALDLSRDGSRLAVAAPGLASGGPVRTYDFTGGTWSQRTASLSADGPSSAFGSGVSLSEDGTRLLVGERGSGSSSGPGGTVRLYERVLETWQPLGALLSATENGEGFGAAVALSGDGTAFVAGSPFFDGAGSDRGRARAYAPPPSPYGAFPLPVGRELLGAINGERFGESVSLAADGLRMAVGRPKGTNGTNSGDVTVYDYVDGAWTRVGNTLTGPSYGFAVELSRDGTRLVVGAYNATTAAGRSGAVDVYDLVGNAWQLNASFDGAGASEQFGLSVALSADGRRLAVGAPGANGFAGYVNIYDEGATGWTQVGTSVLGSGTFSTVGQSIDLSDAGRQLVVGGYGSFSLEGVVRVYNDVNGTWTQIGADLTGANPSDLFGFEVAISGDGSRIATGARGDDAGGSNAGSARVYSFAAGAWTLVGAAVLGQAADEALGETVALSSDGNFLVAGAPNVDNSPAPSAGLVRLYEYDGTVWQPSSGPLLGEQLDERFGRSLSLTPDGAHLAVGAPAHDIQFNATTTFSDAGRAEVWRLSTPSVLPVALESFAASAKTDHGETYVDLDWATASERNSSHFVVERSADAEFWESIGAVSATGDSDEGVAYGFADRRPLPGVSYYRLRQVDLDGEEALSSVVHVDVGSGASAFVLSPNPARGSFTVTGIDAGAEVGVTVTDVTGRVVRSARLTAGRARITLEGLSAGTYAVVVREGGAAVTERLIVR